MVRLARDGGGELLPTNREMMGGILMLLETARTNLEAARAAVQDLDPDEPALAALMPRLRRAARAHGALLVGLPEVIKEFTAIMDALPVIDIPPGGPRIPGGL